MNFMNGRNSTGFTGIGMAMVAAMVGTAWAAMAITRGMIAAGAATRRHIRNRRKGA